MKSIVKAAWTTQLLSGSYTRTNSRKGVIPRCRTASDARSALGVLLEVYITLGDDIGAAWLWSPWINRWGFRSSIKHMDWDTGEVYWEPHETFARFPEHVCEWAGMKRTDLGDVCEWTRDTNSHKKIAQLIEEHIDDEDHSSDWI
tara:strand:+ start:1853 stop:2287 length:435 start_codon:yes stop_codon:yes gene_type:complete